jgi:serine/threonine protein kinase
MVVGRQAFDAADPVALVSQIENEMPANPSTVNAKIQPAVSALIMKALAKDPAKRYQSARELLDDLEKCKDNGKKAARARPGFIGGDGGGETGAAIEARGG